MENRIVHSTWAKYCFNGHINFVRRTLDTFITSGTTHFNIKYYNQKAKMLTKYSTCILYFSALILGCLSSLKENERLWDRLRDIPEVPTPTCFNSISGLELCNGLVLQFQFD